jgi:hypothetical protein
MADTDERVRREEDAELPEGPADDQRKPYEAPRILKKRSVSRSTLFTTMTISAMGLTAMG